MQYRNGCGEDQISILGYGCMRFSRRGSGIDLGKTEGEIKEALAAGINYFDTAYIYPGSETALGKIIKNIGCRQQIYLATKLPHYLIKSAAGLDKYFTEQLLRLQTDYLDYFLLHMLNDVACWEKLVQLGIIEWLAAKKDSGQIRHIGFSFHGNTAMFLEVLAVYDWEFCYIQYNYMDENSQAGRQGLQAAYARGIKVIIMEPLRGGRLASLLPVQAKEIMAKYKPQRSPAAWALHWLWDQPEVSCVLSGMNSLAMLRENVQTAEQAGENQFAAADFEMIAAVKKEINASIKIGCTGCGYCLPCPQGVDIPGTFYCYNLKYSSGNFDALKEYLKITTIRKETTNGGQCSACGRCAKHCPQKLAISSELQKAVKQLETPLYKLAKTIIKLWKPW